MMYGNKFGFSLADCEGKIKNEGVSGREGERITADPQPLTELNTVTLLCCLPIFPLIRWQVSHEVHCFLG